MATTSRPEMYLRSTAARLASVYWHPHRSTPTS